MALYSSRLYTPVNTSGLASWEKSSRLQWSVLRVTLYTCVMDQPEYRWKVTAIQQG